MSNQSIRRRLISILVGLVLVLGMVVSSGAVIAQSLSESSAEASVESGDCLLNWSAQFTVADSFAPGPTQAIITLGQSATATDGFDTECGEGLAPPAPPESVYPRWVLSSEPDPDNTTLIDIRPAAATSTIMRVSHAAASSSSPTLPWTITTSGLPQASGFNLVITGPFAPFCTLNSLPGDQPLDIGALDSIVVSCGPFNGSIFTLDLGLTLPSPTAVSGAVTTADTSTPWPALLALVVFGLGTAVVIRRRR